MPVDGLPLMLETVMNALLESNSVDSWSMRGLMDYSQLTLRFKMAPDSIAIENYTYKKKSQKQVDRDRNRSETWNRVKTTKQDYKDGP